MSEYISDVYEDALMCGISIETFWNSSVVEISDLICAHNQLEKERMKEQISMQFLLADLIDDRISRQLEEKPHEKVREWDVAPELFEKEKLKYEEQKEQEEFESFKMRRSKYASQYNKKMGYE